MSSTQPGREVGLSDPHGGGWWTKTEAIRYETERCSEPLSLSNVFVATSRKDRTISLESNPYKSPQEDCENLPGLRKLLTRQKLFWGGFASVAAAVTAISARDALFVYSKSVHGELGWGVAMMDIVTITALIVGGFAMIASHWFPAARRKPFCRRDG